MNALIEDIVVSTTGNHTYPIKYACRNCGKSQTNHVPVGQRADKTVTCKNCHCDADKCWPGS